MLRLSAWTKSKLDPEHGGLSFTIMLTALSGWVDAVGYIRWRGLFVSFMSGNTTTLGVLVSSGRWGELVTPACVIASFVAGVALGALIGGSRGHEPKVLVLVAGFLIATTLLAPHGFRLTASVLLAAGMGAQSAAVHRAGAAPVAVTYVTGTLVSLGRGIADALTGRNAWGGIAPFAFVWFGLLLGATVGSLVALRSETTALSLASILTLGIAAASWRIGRPAPPTR